jgi:phosphatidylserine decarboxylase
MLANDESIDQFVGGTVYQAYLTAMNYHRWHSPVAGTIVRAFVEQGTYHSGTARIRRAGDGPEPSAAIA